eukprot:CAMPEP_0170514076 /NCGR_PEP_ID=MMETSP0209-20121228/631_1 /TAXON_ID=665100 ORGANISM="Litonotus pictus, Strain P1" /NCGR_SAMPLE_ID=MMETSP0209 /ASSEMBLY_ACC=CAM_ASM_000301 /LENGTH=344 /DNA_ID=CAMNT_0010798001 /DNA_START=284 /DNA_END=1314 /DNA_ORIENTATION=-
MKPIRAEVDEPLYQIFVFECRGVSSVIVKFHHLLGDAVSVQILMNTLLKHYSNFCRGVPYDPDHEDNRTLPLPTEGCLMEDWSSPENRERIDQCVKANAEKVKNFNMTMPFKPMEDINKFVAEKGNYFLSVEGTKINLEKNKEAVSKVKLSLSTITMAAVMISPAIFSATKTGKLNHAITIKYSRDNRRIQKQFTDRMMNYSDSLPVHQFPINLSRNITEIAGDLRKELISLTNNFYLFVKSAPELFSNKEKYGIQESSDRNHTLYIDTFAALPGKSLFPFNYDLGNGKTLELESSSIGGFPFDSHLTPSFSFFNYHKKCNYSSCGHRDEFNRAVLQRHLLNFA